MSSHTDPHVLTVGAHFPQHDLATLAGDTIVIPVADHIVHLQFRRFAGCPICNLHLRSFIQRREEIIAAGITEVIVFHSTVEELKTYQADLPFAVVPDPTKALYREFGVETSKRALLDPRTLTVLPTAVGRSLRAAKNGAPKAPTKPTGGNLGLPADLLIDPQGTVVAAKYGTHAYDQWSVDDLLNLVRQPSTRRL